MCDVYSVSMVTGCCSCLQTALRKKKTFCNQNDMELNYFLFLIMQISFSLLPLPKYTVVKNETRGNIIENHVLKKLVTLFLIVVVE